MCLMLLVECCQDDVYPHVVGVLNENEGDYRNRDAAFMALGQLFLKGKNEINVKLLLVRLHCSFYYPFVS